MTVISSPRLSATRAVRQVNRKLRTDWRPANDRLHRTASPDPHATLGAARGIPPRTPAISPAFSPTCTLHPTARCMRGTIRHYCLDRSPARRTACCGREFATMPRCAHRAGAPATVLASRRITNRLLLCALLCLASTLAVSPVNAGHRMRSRPPTSSLKSILREELGADYPPEAELMGHRNPIHVRQVVGSPRRAWSMPARRLAAGSTEFSICSTGPTMKLPTYPIVVRRRRHPVRSLRRARPKAPRQRSARRHGLRWNFPSVARE